MLINRSNFAAAASKHTATQLGKIATTHAKADIKTAFNALQLDQVPSDPKLLAAYNDLRKVIGDIYGHDAPEMSTFNRLGIKGKDIDSYADKFGLPETARFGTDDPTTVANAWRRWDVDDPLETLNRVHAASQTAGIMRMLGADLSERWGSHAAGPGLVKIKDSGGKTIIGQMINLDKYYPEHIAKEMHVLEASLQTLHNPLTSDKIFKFYDAGLHHLKAGWTIYRPGHHMRNLVGDMFFNYMDGVISPKWYKNAVEVLNVGRGQYKDWDSLQALQSTGIVPDSGRAVTRNGDYALTAKQAHKLMYQTGALPDYKVIEDTAFGSPTADLTNILRRKSPFKGKVHDSAATVSEVRDHYVRASHWLKAFEDVKVPKNIRKLDKDRQLQWMAEEASNRVRKWHPDGSDLTNFEKQAMRRAIPFYSWMRKAIPLVVESMFTRPAKVLAYPKSMYAAAEAMGVDLESFSNPFPTDQLFPEWLRDSTQGPVMDFAGRYFGVKPGIPTADIMDDYFNSPGRTLMGSLTPVIKVPGEVGFRQDARTGIKLTDWSDYIDKNIPGLSNIAALTGRSPSTLGIQPTKQEEKAASYGEGGQPIKPTAAINLMLGAGVMDMSKPNYIKQAEFEERDAARKASREAKANYRPDLNYLG
jgi:hypothetical protein